MLTAKVVTNRIGTSPQEERKQSSSEALGYHYLTEHTAHQQQIPERQPCKHLRGPAVTVCLTGRQAKGVTCQCHGFMTVAAPLTCSEISREGLWQKFEEFGITLIPSQRSALQL